MYINDDYGVILFSELLRYHLGLREKARNEKNGAEVKKQNQEVMRAQWLVAKCKKSTLDTYYGA